MSEILDVVSIPETLEALGPPKVPLLKRIIAGSNDEVIHSLVFEFVSGERRGLCLDENNEPLSVLDDANIQSRIGSDWTSIEYGDYIVEISGFNLDRDEFLCHSVTLQFKSGNEVPFISTNKATKGTPFNYTVPKSSLVTNLVFLFGSMHAIGVKTTSVHLPLMKENMALLPKAYKRSIMHLFLIFKRFLVVDNQNEPSSNLLLPYEIGWKIISFLCGYHLHDEKPEMIASS